MIAFCTLCLCFHVWEATEGGGSWHVSRYATVQLGSHSRQAGSLMLLAVPRSWMMALDFSLGAAGAAGPGVHARACRERSRSQRLPAHPCGLWHHPGALRSSPQVGSFAHKPLQRHAGLLRLPHRHAVRSNGFVSLRQSAPAITHTVAKEPQPMLCASWQGAEGPSASLKSENSCATLCSPWQ